MRIFKYLISILLINYCYCYGIAEVKRYEAQANSEWNNYISNLLAKAKLVYEIGLMASSEPEGSLKMMEAFKKLFSLNEKLKLSVLKAYPYMLFEDMELRWNIERLVGLRDYSLNGDEIARYEDLKDYFEDAAKIISYCQYNNPRVCDMKFDQLLRVVDSAYSIDQIQYYYKEFLNKCGQLKQQYLQLIPMHKKIAREYNNPSILFTAKYEEPDLMEQLTNSVNALKPFYKKLHAYVRYQLQQKYGRELVRDYQPIPVELWMKFIIGRTDTSAFPYPRKQKPSATERIQEISNYTVVDMMHDVETFFTSIGMKKLPSVFWEKSHKWTKSDCKERVLYPEEGDEIALTYCDGLTIEHFYKFHEAFVEIYYKLAQKMLPLIYRFGYWPGHEEAMKKAIKLSIQSRIHHERIGLYNRGEIDDEIIINEQYKMALEMFFTTFEDYFILQIIIEDLTLDRPINNCDYWKKKNILMGIIPSVKRSADQFDLGGDLLTTFGDTATKSLVTKLLSFQFYAGLCKKAGQEGIIPVCDFSGSKAAGNLLKKWMRFGTLRRFSESVQEVTGTDKITADSVLQYFAPLNGFLDRFIANNHIHIGWDEDINVCDE